MAKPLSPEAQALLYAGVMATSAMRLVGGQGLNGLIPPAHPDDFSDCVSLSKLMTTFPIRFKRRCPYRRFLRNVHIRRLYMLTVVPVWIILIIPVAAAKGIFDELKAGIVDTIKAIQDPNSYD